MNILALEVYNESDIILCANNPCISALIMGDLYCTKRMFKYGKAYMLDCIRSAKSNGLYVIYQTPRYITDRNYRENTDMIIYLWNQHLIDAVLIQDIGLLNTLHNKASELKLYWANAAVPRNESDNLLHYRLLKDLGVYGVEVNRGSRLKPLQTLGFHTLAMYDQLTYATVNRECYYLHEKNIFDYDCNRKCLDNSLLLKGKTFEMSIDGYRLGTRYQRTDIVPDFVDESTDVVIYGRSYSTILKEIQELEKTVKK